MPEERRQNLAETDRGSYYNQEEWLEEFLDDKGGFYNGSERDDSDNDENYNENYKNSNSLGFNHILQKFYEMNCETVTTKTLCGIFLIFCRLSFTDNFNCEEQFFGSAKSPKVKYLETHLFYIFFKDLQLFLRLQNH